jgi:RND family efflux transporter MFP subunit
MKRALLPLLILTGGITLTFAIFAFGDKHESKPEQVKTQPLVAVTVVQAVSHQVLLSAWGELKPREITKLSLQVSGRINHLHDNFIEGGIIKKGEVIFTIENDDYLTQIIESEANLASAKSKLAQEVAEANVAKSQWRNNQEQATLLSLREPQLLHARASVKSAQAKLSQSQRNLSRTAFKSPYDALVTNRDVGLGQLANQGAIVGEIYNIEHADVILPIPQFEYDFLPKKINGIDAIVEFNGQYRSAYVSRELGTVSSKTRMRHIVSTIEDPYAIHNDLENMQFGQYVNVKVSAKTLNNVFLINQDHVNDNHVWLLDKNHQLQKTPITTVRAQGKNLYITGLKSGDLLVTRPPSYPQVGMKVRRKVNTLAHELMLLKEAE